VRSGRHGDWDFPYDPSSVSLPIDEADAGDVVAATHDDVDEETFREALRRFAPSVERLIARPPLFWTRIRTSAVGALPDLVSALVTAGIRVRYVTPARTGTMALAAPLDFSGIPPPRAASWPARAPRATSPSRDSQGDWFLGGEGGVRVDRHVCGTGAGTRFAVIDDDAADVELLDLDQVVLVGVERAPATTGHGALMVGWAVGAVPRDAARFTGVAPDASVRLYCVPKPWIDVVSLPLAIARAVLDGADVVVCATYVEGTSSPLLDDALDVATRLGRGGRGAVVVLPTGRETSSGAKSVHASLSLGLGDPASDPRVHCIAPGGKHGGWFLWRTPKGKLRPFSNRGPAVRWLAPGDDVAYPLSSRDHLFHAESSGASAIAAGVVLLLLGCNPTLRLRDVHALLARTADVPAQEDDLESVLADPVDVLPFGRDADGHNAKSGYGRLNAARACACARDPLALELTAMGESELAAAWVAGAPPPYSPRLARWVTRTLLSRPDLEHAMRALLRHARLIAAEPARSSGHAPGALVRQLGLLARELARAAPPRRVREELRAASEALQRASNARRPSDAIFDETMRRLFGRESQKPPVGPGDSISSAGVQS
jgi:hypothetical protein